MRTQLYRHAEAFCLMKYATDDGSEVEWLWNSRDGVTSFVIRSRSGKEMIHADFSLDRCLPNYQPLPGERIFVDVTPERAAEFARRWVDRYWIDPDYPLARMYATQEEAIASRVREILALPGQPDIIEARDWKREPK